MPIPNSSIQLSVSPDTVLEVAPSFYSWAKRTRNGRESNARQLRSLVAYYPDAREDIKQALGGEESFNWAKAQIESIFGSEDVLPVTKSNQLLVLALPYGGPKNGKDIHNQYFSEYTDFMDGAIDTPPAFYAHGTTKGELAEIVGKVSSKYYTKQGGWFVVDLDPDSSYYAQIIDAHQAGTLYVSTGVVPASYHYNEETGHIDTWLVGEISFVDTRDGFIPANKYAIVKCEECDEVIFHDYYGEPVLMDPLISILDRISAWLDSKMSMHKAEEKTPEPEMKAEEKKEEQEMPPEEKCEACDEEAAQLANTAKAEIEQMVKAKNKCAKCPDAINYVKAAVKAGKMSATEAFGHLETFSRSDETYEALVEDVENRTPLGMQKGIQKGLQLSLAGGTEVDPQKTIDQEHMNRQRKLVGLPVKEIK